MAVLFLANELVYKKMDTTIDSDVLELTFHLNSEMDWQITEKTLDYSHDMLVSDYGAIFGFLVGLSLIDTVTFLFAALKPFVLLKINCREGKKFRTQFYQLTKWILVTGLIWLLIVLMLSADFKFLDIFLTKEESTFDTISDESGFLNTNSRAEKGAAQNFTIKWGPDDVGD